MSRTYQDAIALLNRRPRKMSNEHMHDWLMKLGHNPISLPIIHITGTKGKGSTAAHTDALLRAHYHHAPDQTPRKLKIGLYTSPHLVTERERIRIDFEPISEALFASSLFGAWDSISQNCEPDAPLPGYHQLATLTSILALTSENVDMAIYEVHCGGRDDATNVFEHGKVACGFTTMALDHVGVLGYSVADIARAKSGIMRPGVPCFSVVQDEVSARDVLTREAARQRCPLSWVPTRPDLPAVPKLEAATQRMNLSLAVALAEAYIKSRRSESSLSTQDIEKAVELFDWPGRFQRLDRGSHSWFLDSAHNAISLPVALKWYAREVRTSTCKNVLLFGHQAKRDAGDLLRVVRKSCDEYGCVLDAVVLTTYEHEGSRVWTAEDIAMARQILGGKTQFVTASPVPDALAKAKKLAPDGANALVMGAVYIVGEALGELQKSRI